MFGEQFYPTPSLLIEKMLSDVDLSRISSILEPSAGRGDIATFIKSKFETLYKRSTRYPNIIDCIEIDPSLTSVLKGNGFRVIYNDFLQFRTHKKYDLIVMNPPFKNGEKHLLKALELQREGGSIICLLNATTVKNPDSNARKELLEILNSENINYTIEYLENEFSEADRKTNVEVALLKITIAKSTKPSYFRAKLEKAISRKEADLKTVYQVAENDLIAQIVKQFELETEMGIKLIEEYTAMRPYMMSHIEDCNSLTGRHTLDLVLSNSNEKISSVYGINGYLEAVRVKYWSALFANKSFSNQLTTEMQQDLYKRISEFKNYDFSYYNIKELQLELTQNLSLGVENTILEIFDFLSNQYSYTSYSKNIHLYNGWKTNKSWYVNKKVIIPFSGFNTWGDYKLDSYKIRDRFNDIEKSLNYLNGNKPLSIDINKAIDKAIANGDTHLHLNFFDVIFYKKGTAHLTFSDLELLKRLNLYAGRQKSWLPPSYGKKQYTEMNEEEKAVIDDFEGSSSYNQIMNNPKKWLIDSPNIPLLEKNN